MSSADGTDLLDDLNAAQAEDERTLLIQRCAWSLVWLGIATSGLLYWNGWAQWPNAALWSPILVAIGTVGGVLVWTVRRPLSIWMQLAGLIGAMAAVALPAGTVLHARRFFSTDAAAFNQLATRFILHGRNPYTSSMSGAALRPAINYWTYLTDGGHVTQMSYPAGAFLLQVPFMALGWHHELTEWIGLFSWLATGVFLFVVFPRSIRWLAVLVMMSGIFLGIFAYGGTDALFVLFFVIAAWRWDGFAMGRAAGLASWSGPIAMGIACSVKQTPWFAVPFFVIGIAFEARRRGARPLALAARYGLTVVGVFALFNLPFLIWSPSAWYHGTLLPFSKPLVADGQGVVTFALHGLTGGVNLTLLSISAALVYVALVIAFVFWYPALKRSWLFLLPLVLFIPARSLSTYLVGFVPVALAAAVSVTPARSAPIVEPIPLPRGTARWLGPLTLALPAIAAVVVGVIAFSSAPFTVVVKTISTSGHQTSLSTVTVTITNTTDAPLVPHFMVDLNGSHPSGFWQRADSQSPQPVGPGASETVTIRPPTFLWAPVYGQFWLVDVYTTSPTALSTSPPMKWQLGRDQS